MFIHKTNIERNLGKRAVDYEWIKDRGKLNKDFF
jgi:hypothetical protein